MLEAAAHVLAAMHHRLGMALGAILVAAPCRHAHDLDSPSDASSLASRIACAASCSTRSDATKPTPSSSSSISGCSWLTACGAARHSAASHLAAACAHPHARWCAFSSGSPGPDAGPRGDGARGRGAPSAGTPRPPADTRSAAALDGIREVCRHTLAFAAALARSRTDRLRGAGRGPQTGAQLKPLDERDRPATPSAVTTHSRCAYPARAAAHA